MALQGSWPYITAIVATIAGLTTGLTTWRLNSLQIRKLKNELSALAQSTSATRKRPRLHLPGRSQLRPSYGFLTLDSPIVDEILNQLRIAESADFLGETFSHLFADPRIAKALRLAAVEGRCRFRILLLNPNSEHFMILCREREVSGRSHPDLPLEVSRSLSWLAKQISIETLVKSARLYGSFPRLAMIRLDDHLYYIPLLYGHGSQHWPYSYLNRQNRLEEFDSIMSHFDTLWNNTPKITVARCRELISKPGSSGPARHV